VAVAGGKKRAQADDPLSDLARPRGENGRSLKTATGLPQGESQGLRGRRPRPPPSRTFDRPLGRLTYTGRRHATSHSLRHIGSKVITHRKKEKEAHVGRPLAQAISTVLGGRAAGSSGTSRLRVLMRLAIASTWVRASSQESERWSVGLARTTVRASGRQGRSYLLSRPANVGVPALGQAQALVVERPLLDLAQPAGCRLAFGFGVLSGNRSSRTASALRTTCNRREAHNSKKDAPGSRTR